MSSFDDWDSATGALSGEVSDDELLTPWDNSWGVRPHVESWLDDLGLLCTEFSFPNGENLIVCKKGDGYTFNSESKRVASFRRDPNWVAWITERHELHLQVLRQLWEGIQHGEGFNIG